MLVERLCRASERRSGTARDLAWPEALARDAWFFTPELVSLHGAPAYDALPEPTRRRLSFHEAVNFFSLNLHGERVLVRGLAQRATAPEWREAAPYLAHFLADEERHMASFGEFCRRYAGRIYPDRSLAVARAHAPGEEDLLFFAKVLVFEEIVDAYNVRMAADDRLSPLIREINRRHHADERRHLAFGRALVNALASRLSAPGDGTTLLRVRRALESHANACLRDYFSVDAYRDAGLVDPYRLRASALAHPSTKARRRALMERCRRALPDLLGEVVA